MSRVAYLALLLFLFSAPWSLPVGRIFLLVSVTSLLFSALFTRRRLSLPPVWFVAVLCIGFTLYCTWTGINPERGLDKFPKMLWFLGFLAPAVLLRRPWRMWQALSAFSLGSGILAIKLMVEHSIQSVERREKFDGDTLKALIDLGSMTDGQRLLIGLIATLGVILAMGMVRRVGVIGGIRRLGPISLQSKWPWIVLLVCQTAAFVINFKRGSWLCGAVILGALVLLRLGRRWFIAFCVVLMVLVSLPQTQARLSSLGNEFKVPGGRWTMWTDIAPALAKEHPWKGIGYRSLTNDAMRDIAPLVEQNRDHLHSNPVQLLVDTGCIGLVFYTLWFGMVAVNLLMWGRRSSAHPGWQLAALIMGAMFASLLLNGLVEYNIGDGEVVLGYIFIMGAAAAGATATVRLKLPIKR